ncbi:MAG: polysaccharide biosynthesis tyrosine autokinase [Bacteroidetes bacterium]|nr:polysaccharide biosynthesis tyrosine autokinase [Bacteroidota bacterium]HET6244701.1 polysaccharide biosynthesis tyrosine autokinase [Bacteroidia bacterium]
MAIDKGSIIDSKDLKQVWKVFIENWYIMLLFVLISASIAYIYTYKLTDVFAGRTQILIKSSETYDYQNQLYKGLGYYGAYEDISNQKRVITSYNLIEQTVAKLNLDVSYFIIGRLKTTEVYESMPFRIHITLLNNQLFEKPVQFKIIDENKYQLIYEKEDKVNIKKVLSFDADIHETDFVIRVDKSPGITSQTIANLKEIDYFFKVHTKSSLVRKYKNALSVENVEYTSVLQITLEDEIPARAVTFLDTLSKVYIDYTLRSKIDVNENTLTYIDRQLTEAIDMMSEIEDDLEKYRSNKSILNLSREAEEYFDKLLTYDSQKRSLELLLQSIASLEEYIISSKDAKETRLLPPAVYINDDDDFLKKSVNELYTMQIGINSMYFSAKEENAGLQQMKERVEFLRKDILVYLTNSKKAIRSKIEDIKAQIRQYETIIKSIPKTQRDMLNINRKLQVNEKMYLYLLEKKANTVIARAGIIPETKVIESAMSIGLVKPNKSKIIYTASLIGLVFSFILIFVRIVFFEKIENSTGLKEMTSIPVFGEIIYANEAETEYIIVDSNPKSAITESFRSVRTNLEYLPVEGLCKTILITSHNPNEGKTFCSINLAAIIAKADKKVLLLELDLHKPKVYVGLKLKSELGISSILAGKVDTKECIMKTSIENLDVILSGPIPPNASELILNKRLLDLLEYGKNLYDYIIIDTPPIGLITDALVLMKYADATLFVLNTQFAKKEYVKNAEEVVTNNGVRNFGFLLNGVKIKKSKYYYNYSYGYKYGYGKGYGYGYGTNKNS